MLFFKSFTVEHGCTVPKSPLQLIKTITNRGYILKRFSQSARLRMRNKNSRRDDAHYLNLKWL